MELGVIPAEISVCPQIPLQTLPLKITDEQVGTLKAQAYGLQT